MVLLKRRADGTYTDWRIPDQQPVTSSSTDVSSKRPRLDSGAGATGNGHPPNPFDLETTALSTAQTSRILSLTEFKAASVENLTKSFHNHDSFRHRSTHTLSSPISQKFTALCQPSSSSSSSRPSTSQIKGKSCQETPSNEKRLARFKPKCPQAISERLHRYFSQSQRIYMIDRIREGDALSEEFIVQGSTGNVYSVTIDNLPRCNCPDHQKGNHCKHILFIFMKVLQVPQTSALWYQKALLSSELAEIFAAAPPAPQLRGNVVATQRVVGAWRDATGRAPSTPSKPDTNDSRRIPSPEDDCPICYDSMTNGNGTIQELAKVLTWCESCHNAVHNECWKNWFNAKRKQSQAVTCVYCRSPWRSGTVERREISYSSEGYLNLSQVSGVSPVRDTSTYYDGPRRRSSHSHAYRSYLY